MSYGLAKRVSLILALVLFTQLGVPLATAQSPEEVGEDTGDKYPFLPFTQNDPNAIPDVVPDAETDGAMDLSAITASTFYVATNGNDSSAGTLAQPWRTFQKAFRTARAGDTVLFRSGTYSVGNSDNPVNPSNSGTASASITYKAYPGETPILKGSYPGPSSRVQCGISIYGKSYVTIEGLTVRGFRIGICIAAPAHHNTIRNNVLEYNSVGGVSSAGAASGSTNGSDYLTVEGNIVRYNGFRDNGSLATGASEGWGSGIIINPHLAPYRYDTNNSRFHTIVRNNIIYRNYDGTGGDTDSDADHTDGNGVIVDYGGDMPPVLIENNVIFDNGGRCIHVYGGRNVWIIGNTCYRNQSDPGFKNASTGRGEMTGHDLQSPFSAIRNIYLQNNIVYASGDRRVTYYPGVSTSLLSIANNVWYGGTFGSSSPKGISYIESDPRFVAPSTNGTTANFHLQSNSPAINRGMLNLFAGAQTMDIDRQARPQSGANDIGADEYMGGSVPPPPTATPPSSGSDLVGYWRLDEGSGTTAGDSSGNGRTGTLSGGPAWITGLSSRALYFDGSNDYVAVGDNNALSPHTDGAMTLSAWVNMSQRPSTSGQGRTVIAGKGNSGQWEYALYADAYGRVGFSLWQLSGSSYSEIFGGSLPLNGWHHVAGVVTKGQSVRLYLDGALVAQSTSFSGNTGNGNAPFYIGRRGDGQYFRGAVDEVRLYNRALSASEVQSQYNALSMDAAVPVEVPLETVVVEETPVPEVTEAPTEAAPQETPAVEETPAPEVTAAPTEVAPQPTATEEPASPALTQRRYLPIAFKAS